MMDKERITKKLSALRKKYPDESSRNSIDGDEKKLRELIAQEKFSKHFLVQKIIADAQERIDDLNFQLAYDEELNKPENQVLRHSLFRQREVWQFTLERFDMGEEASEQIKQIESEVDEELTRE